MSQGEPLEAPREALARSSGKVECRLTRRNHVDGRSVSMESVPNALQAGGPIVEQRDLVQKEHRTALRSNHILGFRQHPLPKPRKQSFGRIRRSVNSSLSEAIGDLQQQRRLSYLTGAREQLDPTGGRLRQPPGEQLPALEIALAEAFWHI